VKLFEKLAPRAPRPLIVEALEQSLGLEVD